MLAYLDEILDPADQEEIGRKIEESEFASDLVRRTRDVVGRLRLGAPQLTGPGEEIDANSVAEYLDNAMPAERVPDFERACLDSDVALAEVAACHQILTLVLGQPAEVDPASRERMYRVPATLTGEPAFEGEVAEPVVEGPRPGGEGTGGVERADAPCKVARSKPEIPDYLREPSGPPWRGILTVAAMVLVLAGAIWVAFGPRPFRNRLAGRNGVDEETSGRQAPVADHPLAPLIADGVPGNVNRAAGDSGAAARAAASQPAAGKAAAGANERQAAGAVSAGRAPQAAGPPRPSLASPPVVAEQENANAPTAPEPSDVLAARPTSGSEVASAEPDESDTVLAGKPRSSTSTAGATTSEATTEASAGTIPLPEPTKPPAEAAATAATEPARASDIAGKLAASTAEPGRAGGPFPLREKPSRDTAPSTEVAIYSNKDPLLKYDRKAVEWRRLPPRSPIGDQDRLLALPTFHPTILVGTGVSIELTGGTSVEFRRATAGVPPRLAVRYGRLVVINAAGSDNRLRIDLDRDAIELDLGGIGATLAIELVRTMPPGTDPEAAPAPLVTRLFATNGKIGVKIGPSDTTLQSPAGVEISSGQVQRITPPPKPPAWVDADHLGGIDGRASTTLRTELALDRPAGLVLQELVEGQRSGRRTEVRSLAARCSIYVGRFEPFVEALNDPRLKAAWRPRLIETLRDALALGPDVAADVRRDFRKQRGDKAGDALFRMLWGYTSQDLKRGADRELVAYLENEQLDFRLLAVWNLIHITGLGQTSRLEDPKENRWQVARRWKKRFQEGQIVPKAPTP